MQSNQFSNILVNYLQFLWKIESFFNEQRNEINEIETKNRISTNLWKILTENRNIIDHTSAIH